ncbi:MULTISPECIES: sigma-54-dependent transcriptional regulator [unclassified Clostridium]|uniref:sigma-54-dependent transcriptional regulator n=1 Tax=unclassified Clostridium TaxID=2614128 RepID=UPI0002978135|nr:MULTISPECIES: sigma-54-dependent transcriptional regulator [unclassified Clostridium]EKQ56782.1 MAG: response regulator (CheY-like, AAA-type ATPase, and DNA-binding domain containing protein) [Clostridium sp. Maddingley MBC34-26]
MKIKILFLAPYLGLKDLVMSILDEYKDIQIDVYQGNYEKGPKLIQELKAEKNYNAIITRGGTAEICRKITKLPIIEVYINAFDILRILKLSQGYQGKKIFLAYPSISKSFKQLSEFLGYSIESQCYNQHKDINNIIDELKNESYELVIGDNTVYETAQEFGINSILLTSGIEGVRSAIDEAIRLCNAIVKDKEKALEVNDYIDDKNLDDGSTHDFIQIFKGHEISPSHIHTVFPQTILSQIIELSNTPLPTIITGEDGMCKSDVGYLCTCYGPQKRKNLLCVGCYLISEDYDYDLLNNVIIEHLYNEGGTLFLEDIDTLNKEGQKKIANILKKLNKNNDIKIIASCELPVEICVSNGNLLKQLRSILDEVRIELLPFRNYSSEITNMVSMYLAKLDVRCSSQIVGVKDNGIKLLCNYEWPENIRQFMRVINQLTLTCNGSYIGISEIKNTLRIERNNHKEASLVPIDLSGSLRDIEARIIEYVMIQEGMNQVKVEKRLKIGHSTLWRKLK